MVGLRRRHCLLLLARAGFARVLADHEGSGSRGSASGAATIFCSPHAEKPSAAAQASVQVAESKSETPRRNAHHSALCCSASDGRRTLSPGLRQGAT